MKNNSPNPVCVSLTLKIADEEYIPLLLEDIESEQISMTSISISEDGRLDTVPVDLQRLTATQWNTLKIAYERGYYASPRQADLQTLSELCGVTQSAVSQRLNTAESKIIRNAIQIALCE